MTTVSIEDWWVSAWNKSNGRLFLVLKHFCQNIMFFFVRFTQVVCWPLHWNTEILPCFTTSQVTLVCCGSIFCVYGEAWLEFLAPPMAGKLKRLKSIPHYCMRKPGITSQVRMIWNDGFSNSGIVCKAFSVVIPIFCVLTLMFCLLQVLESPMGVLSFLSTSPQYLAKLHIRCQLTDMI